MRRFLVAVLLLVTANAARAELITSPARFRMGTKVIDFSQFSGPFMDFTNQQISIG